MSLKCLAVCCDFFPLTNVLITMERILGVIFWKILLVFRKAFVMFGTGHCYLFSLENWWSGFALDL